MAPRKLFITAQKITHYRAGNFSGCPICCSCGTDRSWRSLGKAAGRRCGTQIAITQSPTPSLQTTGRGRTWAVGGNLFLHQASPTRKVYGTGGKGWSGKRTTWKTALVYVSQMYIISVKAGKDWYGKKGKDYKIFSFIWQSCSYKQQVHMLNTSNISICNIPLYLI